MFDYQRYFDTCCKENGLELNLCFDMPEGYENANGMFDDGQRTVYINRKGLEDRPDFEKAFYLFHELRHAAQYLFPDRFPELIRKSLQYVIGSGTITPGVNWKAEKNGFQRCILVSPMRQTQTTTLMNKREGCLESLKDCGNYTLSGRRKSRLRTQNMKPFIHRLMIKPHTCW